MITEENVDMDLLPYQMLKMASETVDVDIQLTLAVFNVYCDKDITRFTESAERAKALSKEEILPDEILADMLSTRFGYEEEVLEYIRYFYSDIEERQITQMVLTNDVSGYSLEGMVDECLDAFYGKHDSEAEFAEDYFYNTGMMENVPEAIQYHIDWDSVWSSQLRFDFVEVNGYYFNTNR